MLQVGVSLMNRASFVVLCATSSVTGTHLLRFEAEADFAAMTEAELQVFAVRALVESGVDVETGRPAVTIAYLRSFPTSVAATETYDSLRRKLDAAAAHAADSSGAPVSPTPAIFAIASPGGSA